jgi:DNA-binding GntR family transcriptional regulator
MERDAVSARSAESPLVAQIASAILAVLREDDLPVGARLTERGLAERLRVSRSPVRAALQQLQGEGHIERTESGRYLVATPGSEIAAVPTDADGDEELYLRIAADRLDGLLPPRISEAALARRYDVTRSRLAPLLMRAASEGWAAPRPGKGWEFLEVLDSLKSYRDSYRFRILVEPAAILEPTFVLDREAIRRRRAEQQELVDGRIVEVTAPEVFELNSSFHDAIARCSGNDFFVDSLSRVNRLRRLVEYRQRLDPARAAIRCREHVHLADLLLDDDRKGASAYLLAHLTTVGDEKTADAHFGL